MALTVVFSNRMEVNWELAEVNWELAEVIAFLAGMDDTQQMSDDEMGDDELTALRIQWRLLDIKLQRADRVLAGP